MPAPTFKSKSRFFKNLAEDPEEMKKRKVKPAPQVEGIGMSPSRFKRLRERIGGKV